MHNAYINSAIKKLAAPHKSRSFAKEFTKMTTYELLPTYDEVIIEMNIPTRRNSYMDDGIELNTFSQRNSLSNDPAGSKSKDLQHTRQLLVASNIIPPPPSQAENVGPTLAPTEPTHPPDTQ